MSDQFGAMTLPAAAGGLSPLLVTLLDFARAVLASELAAAWGDAAPAEPNEIVNKVFAEDPARSALIERDLPALFAYVDGGSFDDQGDGFVKHTGKVRLKWLFPPATKERKRPIDRVSGALAKAFAAALSDGRHVAWTHPDDEAKPTAIRLTAAAPGVDTTYDGTDLDGDVGAAAWPVPGRVLLTKSAGTWDTSKPVTVAFELPSGVEDTEDIYFTSATDAETAEGAWVIAKVVDVSVPGGNACDLSVGIALAPACEFGSVLKVYTGATQHRVEKWSREWTAVEQKGAPAMKFDSVCFELAVEEVRARTGDAFGFEMVDDAEAGVGMTGMVVSRDGLSVEVQGE